MLSTAATETLQQWGSLALNSLSFARGRLCYVYLVVISHQHICIYFVIIIKCGTAQCQRAFKFSFVGNAFYPKQPVSYTCMRQCHLIRIEMCRSTKGKRALTRVLRAQFQTPETMFGSTQYQCYTEYIHRCEHFE